MNRTILVPIDYSDVTDALLDEARQLATALDAGLHLVHVVAMDQTIYSPCHAGAGTACLLASMDDIMRSATDQLTKIVETLRPDVRAVTTSLIEGHAGHGIMEEAQRVRPMMIVLGSHGHGALHHLLAGSVCEHVMKHAACPIVIVPSRAGTYEAQAETAHTATTA
jgi:nucleotide-binding universal stress UspA family protein